MSLSKLQEIVIFTVIETATMAGWLALALAGHGFLSIVVLGVGLLVEHVVAYNTGANRPFISVP